VALLWRGAAFSPGGGSGAPARGFVLWLGGWMVLKGRDLRVSPTSTIVVPGERRGTHKHRKQLSGVHWRFCGDCRVFISHIGGYGVPAFREGTTAELVGADLRSPAPAGCSCFCTRLP